MKRLLLVFIILILLLSCSNERDRIVRTGKQTLKLPERAKVSADLIVLRNAIAQYRITHNKYPQSLEELNIKINLSYDEYQYNAENGIVKSKHYPDI